MIITQCGQNAESVTVKMAVSVVTTVLQRIKCGKKNCKSEIFGVYEFQCFTVHFSIH